MPPDPVQEEPQGPRVSAILLAFNQAAALRRAIEALERSQDRERLEIVVVDCGSQDESSRLDADYPAINMMRLPHHLGAARAMNIGTRTAKADLLFYLSPNVEVEPNTVAGLADRLESSVEDIAACPLLVDPEGRPVPHVHALPDKGALSEAARSGHLAEAKVDLTQESIAVGYPTLDALMVRKIFIRGMNYFDQRYGHYWADLDLAMQARRAGKKIRLHTAVRATFHAAPDPLEGEPLAAADRLLGAAAFLGKYEGSGAAFGLRFGAALRALGGLDFGQTSALISGQKIDGSQTG
jgi:GT2 family glycosyltransferase